MMIEQYIYAFTSETERMPNEVSTWAKTPAQKVRGSELSHKAAGGNITQDSVGTSRLDSMIRTRATFFASETRIGCH